MSATRREKYAGVESGRLPSSFIFRGRHKVKETVPGQATDRLLLHNHDKLATMGESEIQAKIDEIGEFVDFAEKTYVHLRKT